MSESAYRELCEVAGPVSRETFGDLLAFETEFRRWSAKINLASPSTLPDLWTRHILDSAQVPGIAPKAIRWLDLGSGGGFPGAIIAIMMKERSGAAVALVESNRKKAAFLQSILGRLGAPATVLPVRIEDAVGRVAQPEIVTARALAPLSQLIGLASPWLRDGAKAIFHKGRDYRTEIANCAADWRFDLIEHRSAVDAEGVILEISNVEAIARSQGRTD
ncbi:MAG: 16S rRNA (guanine(527)-N(7))-methyltransferase RsmG [Mesorhizobium sp.]|nr:16S rRNA (guanine(527)-N(7))-methyltransferase RsmG [Mesorhizobium sp.]MCO5161482.1 16S rRNA (guanine(527)-N(7))-methyltransferase RsmG [Mesorhizobium sp.]